MSLETYDHIFEPGDGRDPRTLVLLHGTGGDARSFLPLGEAVAPGAALLSITGNVDEMGMARFFRRKAEGVYDMADLAKRTEDLRGFIDTALVQHGRDRGAAIGIGYSNGANILANLLFTAPETLRNAVLMHPLIPFEPPHVPGLAGARVLVTAGARDPIAPAHHTDRLEAWFGTAGVHVDRLRHPGGHEVRPEEVQAAQAWVAALTAEALAA